MEKPGLYESASVRWTPWSARDADVPLFFVPPRDPLQSRDREGAVPALPVRASLTRLNELKHVPRGVCFSLPRRAAARLFLQAPAIPGAVH
jgi:hypothetical protein